MPSTYSFVHPCGSHSKKFTHCLQSRSRSPNIHAYHEHFSRASSDLTLHMDGCVCVFVNYYYIFFFYLWCYLAMQIVLGLFSQFLRHPVQWRGTESVNAEKLLFTFKTKSTTVCLFQKQCPCYCGQPCCKLFSLELLLTEQIIPTSSVDYPE